jgi:hypothetical protein
MGHAFGFVLVFDVNLRAPDAIVYSVHRMGI